MNITDPMVLYLIQTFKNMFVPAEKGKGLSTNDFTDEYKAKVDGFTGGGGGGDGADGKDGATFIPSVSTAGVISWTNDGGLANPSPVNIKGPKGDQGPQGATGPQGDDYVLTQEDKEEIAGMVTPSGGGSSEKYAVGDIFITTRNGNPSSLLGYGTWEQIKDRFILAAGDTYAAGSTGGEATHTLTIEEIPSHTHETYRAMATAAGSTTYLPTSSAVDHGVVTTATGGGQAHNNMPPFLAVYMWIRTA